MSRTARECIKHGCQHPDACSQCRCWIMEELYEQPDEPVCGEDCNDEQYNDPRHGQTADLNRRK